LKTCLQSEAGFAFAYILAGIALLGTLSVLAYGAWYGMSRGAAITTSKNLSSNLLNQASYSVITNSSDSDGDGIPESPAGPLTYGDGWTMPNNIGAPLADGWGTALKYCAWDNGTIQTGAGATNASTRFTGDNPGTQNSVVFAIISAGPDKVFQTTCAQAKTGNFQGDDGGRFVTVAQINQGVGGTIYLGDAVATVAALNALNTATIKIGQTRVVIANGQTYMWTGAVWQQISNVYQ